MNKEHFVIGIDPGLTGGIVILDSNHKLISKYIMPTVDGKFLDLASLASIFSLYAGRNLKVFLEQVHSMPEQGVASSFKFGRVFGAIEGLLTGIKFPYVLVTPQRWQKQMHEGIEHSIKPKKRSLMAFSRMFPDVDLRATERCRNQHEGLVDALLIAVFGLEHYGI